jgi:DNA-binding transcriptional MerR regulator
LSDSEFGPDLTKRASLIPSFLAGSETLFVGQGTDIAYVDFSQLNGQSIKMSADRTTVTVTLPKAQLEPAVLNGSQSYVYAQQQGLFNRIGNFFAANPNSQQQVYILAQQKIQTAAQQSPLLTQAQKNTTGMLDGMLTSLGFTHVTVDFTGLRTTFALESALTHRLEVVTTWSIGEAAEKCGLSQHTLRWYERIGLLGAIERGGDGRRRFSDRDLDWLSLLTKLRATGMPVRDMQRYAELVRSGAGEAERIELLKRHREQVRRALATQRECLKLLDAKIARYSSALQPSNL